MVLETASAGAADESSRREGIDPLTGLADRGVILDKLSRIIHGDRLEDRRCAVLFVDVDGFKQVNDVYGHLVGDRVLGEVARRLKGCLRARDCVARFGGDEFLVLLERIGGRERDRFGGAAGTGGVRAAHRTAAGRGDARRERWSGPGRRRRQFAGSAD